MNKNKGGNNVMQPQPPNPNWYQPPGMVWYQQPVPPQPQAKHGAAKGVAIGSLILAILLWFGSLIPIVGFFIGLLCLGFLCTALIAMLIAFS